MLKKILCFFIVIVVFSSISFAEEDIYKDFYTISNKKIISESNERVVVSFDITNKTSNYYPELYFTPMLKISDEDGLFFSNYYRFSPTKISLDKNEVKTLAFKLDMPKELPNRKYMITVEQSTLTFKLSVASINFLLNNVTGEGKFVDSLGEYWKLRSGELVLPGTGPNVTSASLPTIYLTLKNNFSYNKNIYPHYVIYRRSPIFEPTPIYDRFGDGIEINAGETKEIFLNVPEEFATPESYLLNLSFEDEAGSQISNVFDFRYVIKGASAKINSIELENGKIKTYVYGPADGNQLDVKLGINVYDENGGIIKQVEQDVNIGGEEEFFVTDIGNISQRKVYVQASISKSEEVLALKQEEIEVVRKTATETLTDIVGTKYEEAVKVLNGLGVINGYPDNTFKPGNQITRAEFSTIVTKLLDLELSENEEIIFYDTADHWAKPYINRIYKEGLVSGYPDGSFGPQNNVTYAEALTILVNALGYKAEANSSDMEWPNNYIVKALRLGLKNDVDIKDYMTPANRGDISILTLNTYLLKK